MPSRKELEAEYKKIARRADDRLRSIEAYSEKPGFQGIKEYAYKAAQADIKRFGGNNRFGRGKSGIPKSTRMLQAKISAINKFLESPSSVIQKTETINGHKVKFGILPMYKQRSRTLNKNWGTKFTWQSLAKYYENGLNEKLEKLVGGSGDALNVVAEIQKNKKTIKEAIKANDGRWLEFDDEIVTDQINELLNDEFGVSVLKALL